MAIAIIVAGYTSLRGRSWAPDSPEVKVIVEDEWRRANLNRAFRGALIVVLAAEWPLGLTLGSMTRAAPERTAMAMAAATITLGLVSLITLFLFFDRE